MNDIEDDYDEAVDECKTERDNDIKECKKPKITDIFLSPGQIAKRISKCILKAGGEYGCCRAAASTARILKKVGVCGSYNRELGGEGLLGVCGYWSRCAGVVAPG